MLENRYDTDRVRYLAKEAEYKVLLPMHIAKQEEILDDKDFETEDYLLLSYEPLTKIGESLNMNLRFDQGIEGPLTEIQNKISNDKQRIVSLKSSLYNEKMTTENQKSMLSEQQNIISDMEGTLTEEALESKKRQAVLQTRINRMNEISAKFEQVQMIFSKEEAEVFRQKNDVIIRMIGINFDVNKSEIKQEDYAQLTKLQEAMGLFTDATIVVEGHTDSQGGDEQNLKLSQERADAVLSYLNANTTGDKSRFSTKG